MKKVSFWNFSHVSTLLCSISKNLNFEIADF
jgi:hypothetical protein